PSGGALVAGNTVVFKPASATPLLGYMLYEMMAAAGMPPGVFNFITGGGHTAGQELVDNPGVDGIVFTGSKDVGMHLIRDNATRSIATATSAPSSTRRRSEPTSVRSNRPEPTAAGSSPAADG